MNQKACTCHRDGTCRCMELSDWDPEKRGTVCSVCGSLAEHCECGCTCKDKEEIHDADWIRQRLQDIAAEGQRIVYTDQGNGAAGAGTMDPETIERLLESDELEDGAVVTLDEALRREAFSDIDEPNCDETEWIQIEYSDPDDAGPNAYSQIAWIWE